MTIGRSKKKMLSVVVAPMVAVVVAAPGFGLMTPMPASAQEVADAANSSPWSRFRFGFSAYKSGRKDEALKAYRDAAEQGHAGARWKLATMYASGDGVQEDDYEAYQLYEGLVNDGAAPGTGDETFVSSALFSLASYLRRGIPNSPIAADPFRARQLYLQSASQFGDPNAQFEIGRMYLMGEGGAADALQAARWFKLAAQKGHVGAEAMLGKTLFDSGRTKQGLSILTNALFKAQGTDLHWIRALQEEAFALASEADRRSVIPTAN